MSGIVGLLQHDGRPTDPSAVEAMLAAIEHRGRDGKRIWHGGRIALGCNRLATGARSDDAAPPADGELAIAADARLDNRDALAAALGLPGKPDDDALILAAYRRWGEDCPRHLLGDFAFAIWDARRQTLFCARDHFGVKPFYYHAGARAFAFASESKALFALAQVPRRIDERRIADYLAGLIDDPVATLHADIAALPPRHTLTVTHAGAVLRAYCEIEPGAPPEGDAAEALRAIFAEAVRCRLDGADPIGAMLSGGLDSSSIACLAAPMLSEAGRGPLRTFSLVFDRTPELSERPFIEAALATGGFDPRFIAADDYDPFADAEGLLAEQDGVFLATGLAVTRRLYRAAAATGVRVLLDGHGGDEAISHGHGRLHELARAGRWIALWREAAGAAGTSGERRARVFDAYFRRYGPVGALRRMRRTAARAIGRDRPIAGEPANRLRLVAADLARQSDLVERYRATQAAEAAASRDEKARHAWLLTAPRVSRSFAVLDHVAAAAGVEPRYPFWDKRLVEFCLALPSHEKLRDGWSRSILRRAMEGILPASIQWRRDKLDFGPHIVRGMLAGNRDLLDRILRGGDPEIDAFVDRGEAAAAYERILANPDGADGRDVQAVWRTTMLALWLGREGGRSRRVAAAA